MKKFKRFAALICAILLFLMYVSTLVFAFIDKSRSLGLLKASVACTTSCAGYELRLHPGLSSDSQE